MLKTSALMTQVNVEGSHILTDEWGATEPGVGAIGDVAGPSRLAHKASHEGVICVEKIAGQPGIHPLDINRIPGCTYCHPQVASIGLTETAFGNRGITMSGHSRLLETQGDRTG